MLLYLHIPFCAHKCAYCDFVSFAGREGDFLRYTDALIAEMDRRPSSECVTSVFLGGGTPSLLPAQALERLLTAIRVRYDISPGCEITVEMNPGTLRPDWLDAATRGGVNRLSMGVQSVQGELLHKIGRIHDFAQVEQSFALARQAGIRNINADLMYALPTQTVAQWRESLLAVLSLQPWHLSCYALTVSEDTPFGEMDRQGRLPRPSEDEEMQMQQTTRETLARAGLYQYEVSNYCKPGCACRHNVGYWTRKNYIGLGCAAASLENGVRRLNTSNLDDYLAGAPFVQEETLTQADAEFEELMLGLRLKEGVTLTGGAYARFAEKLHVFALENLLTLAQAHVRLTDRGFDVMNTILSDLMPD